MRTPQALLSSVIHIPADTTQNYSYLAAGLPQYSSRLTTAPTVLHHPAAIKRSWRCRKMKSRLCR